MTVALFPTLVRASVLHIVIIFIAIRIGIHIVIPLRLELIILGPWCCFAHFTARRLRLGGLSAFRFLLFALIRLKSLLLCGSASASFRLSRTVPLFVQIVHLISDYLNPFPLYMIFPFFSIPISRKAG